MRSSLAMWVKPIESSLISGRLYHSSRYILMSSFQWARAIFVLEMKTCEQNRNNKQTEIERFVWFIERIQTLGWKNFMPENFLEINRYFTLTSYCNTIGQSNNAFSLLGFSLAGKRRVHVSIFFIRWLIKQITNPYWNYFSKSYENRSNCVHIHSAVGSMIKEGCRWRIRKPSSLSVLKVVEASFILQVTSKSLEKHDSLKICILRFYMFHQAL